jgi:hypothetical protein
LDEQRGYDGLNDCSEFRIPQRSALKVVRAVREVLLELWSYLVRYPEQVRTRFLPWNARWQLHHPPSLDWLIAQLQDTLTGDYEPLRLQHPELYHGKRNWQRLQAYSEGKLRWRGAWGNELRAQDKLVYAKQVLRSAAHRLLTAFVRCWLLLQCLVVKQVRTRTGEQVVTAWHSQLVPQYPYAPTLSRPPPLL